MDERLQWIEERVSTSLKPRAEEFKQLFGNEKNQDSFSQFFTCDERREIFIYFTNVNGELLKSSLNPPNKVPDKKFLTLMKTATATKINQTNINTDLFCMEWSSDCLQHFEALTRSIFLPLLYDDESFGITGDRLMELLHRIIASSQMVSGKCKGEIILALPNMDVLLSASSYAHRQLAVIHILETTLIGWIKQIKSSLKIDIEAYLKKNNEKISKPWQEVQFWEDRSVMLNSLNEQLCSSHIISVLTMLEEVKSSYAQSFHLIKRNIAQADIEVNENLTFLGTLKSYFEFMDESYEPEQLTKCFAPLMHTLLLVWTYSRFYHSPVNMSRLLNMISNQLVSKAQEIVGESILTNANSNFHLHNCLQICAAFRGTYLDNKDKADAINQFKLQEQSGLREDQDKVVWHSSVYCTARTPRGVGLFTKQEKDNNNNSKELYWEDSPWPNRSSEVFYQLNSFMERCNDVLELVDVTHQFKNLQSASDMGAADTSSHNSQLVEIQEAFADALKIFNRNVQEPLDILKSQNFEASFFEFRSSVRELEMQLGCILSESLKACWDTQSKLRLLDVFQGITKRELVQNVLHQTLEVFVIDVKSEIKATEELLSSGVVASCCHDYLPPVTNNIIWLRSLQKRVESLLETLNTVAPMCFKGEAGWKLKDSFLELKATVARKEDDIVSDWLNSFTVDLFDKFSEPILVLDTDKKICVNFNGELQHCLQELHYLSSILNIDFPQDITKRLQHVNNGEVQSFVTRLNTSVTLYNDMLKSVTGIDRVLINDLIEKSQKLLLYGLNNLTWKDSEVKDFVERCVFVICNEFYQTVVCVKDNHELINQIVLSWADTLVDFYTMEGSNKPIQITQWNESILKLTSDSNNKIELGSKKINDYLEETANILKINKCSPHWLDYLDLISESICNGVINSIVITLKYIYNRMVAASLQSSTNAPLLEIDLLLTGTSILFAPPIDKKFAEKSLPEHIENWIENIMQKSKYVIPLVTTKCFTTIISSNVEIQDLIQNINVLVHDITLECTDLVDMFKDYAFLWTHNVNQTFQEFLAGNFTSRSHEEIQEESNVLNERSSRASFGSISKIKSDFNDASSGRSSALNSTTTGLTSGTLHLKKFNSSVQDKINTKPTLDDFEREIEIFQTVIKELLASPISHTIGWIQVNLQPIKHTITSYASKWMYTYTKYLSDQVESSLTRLDVFLGHIEPGIESITGDETGIESITGDETNISSFMKLMRIFNEVTRQQSDLDQQFIDMKKTIKVLEKFQQKLTKKTQEFYSVAPARWNNLKMKVNQAKQRLGPRIQSEQASVAKVLKEFREQCRNVWFEIEDSKIYSRDCDVTQAFIFIEQFTHEVYDLEEEAQDLIELQELLEKSVVDFKVLTRMHTVLGYLKQVWETFKILQDQHIEWKRHRWMKIKIKLLKRGLDAQYELVMKLPDEAHSWDVTLSLIEMINDILACLPIMEDLGKAALRPRHWKQLIRVTGSIINTSNEAFTKMNLKEFIELGLQHNAEEVRAVVKKSSKDVGIENTLKLYEEVWLSKVFETKSHTRLIIKGNSTAGNNSYAGSEFGGTESEFGFSSVPASGFRRSRLMSATSVAYSVINVNEDPDRYLICNVEPILEELHSHQVSLQTMLQHSSATSFLDEINKWQKTLQNTEFIISLLIQVQEKWQMLDEVYSSSEMHSSFPHESALFQTSSQEFHSIIKQIEKNPNVLQICSQNNLLHRMEKLHMSMDQCDKVITNYLERRRHRYPKLLLLSLNDAYAILCKGYDPKLLSPYLSSLFHSISSLDCIPSNDGALYHITGFNSIYGEHVDLVKPFVCETGVEYWLPNLQNTIALNLKLNLAELLGSQCSTNEAILSLLNYKNDQQTVQEESMEIKNRKHRLSSYMTTISTVSNPVKEQVDKSFVFTYLLKTILPLPDTWTFNACSDVVALSLKYITSTLLCQHIEAYHLNSSSLDLLVEKLHAVITSLSDFLLAQTKIKIHKKNLAKTEIEDDFNFDIDISASNHSRTGCHGSHFRVANQNTDHSLLPCQISLLESLIQYFFNEQQFIKNIKEMFETSYNPQYGLPFEWKIHPKYEYDDNSGDLNVVLNECKLNYEFEFQGLMAESFISLTHSRSLYWMVQSILNHQFTMVVTETKNGYDEYLKHSVCNLIGRQMFVYNCNSSTSSNVLMDLFKGVLSTGCWISFDNLSALSVSMISLMANQLQLIQNALKERKEIFTINQEEITLINSSMIFTNSSLTEKLPADVSKRFRSVKYTVPDIEIILKINLIRSAMIFATALVAPISNFLMLTKELFPCLSNGIDIKKLLELSICFYENYKEILKCKDGQKIAKELSSVTEVQVHQRGSIKNIAEDDEMLAENDGDNEYQMLAPDHTESKDSLECKEELEQSLQCKSIITALHQSFTPALNEDELILFESILNESFQHIDVYSLLEENIKSKESRSVGVKLDLEDTTEGLQDEPKVMDSIYKMIDLLSCTNDWNELVTKKVIQITELTTHYSMIAVCGSNKTLSSICIQSFLTAYKQYDKKTQCHTICLSAMESNELFGYFIEGTRKWKEGILPMVIKTTKDEGYHFIHLTSILSNEQEKIFNQLATCNGNINLPNGEFIIIPQNVRFIWQVSSLSDLPMEIRPNVSLISINNTELTLYHQLRPAFHTKPSSAIDHLITLFTSLFETTNNFLKQENIDIGINVYNIVQTALSIFESITSQVQISSDYDNYAYYAIYWSFSSHLSHSTNQQLFSHWWKKIWSTEVNYPSDKEVWNFFVNPDTHLFTDVEDSLLFTSLPHSDMIVHSQLTMSTSYLLHSLLTASQSFIIYATSGSGKSAILRKEVLQHKPDGVDFDIMFVDVNDYLTCEGVWNHLNDVMEWKHSTYYLPSGNKKLICVVEDLHLCHVNELNLSPVCDLLHQLITCNGAFNPIKNQWQEFGDVIFIVTYDPQSMTPYSLSHNNMMESLPLIQLTYPLMDDEIDIFYTLMLQHLILVEDQQLFFLDQESLSIEKMKRKREILSLEELLKMLVTITVEFQANLKEMYLVTSQRRHYVFTLKNLHRFFSRLCFTISHSWSHGHILKAWCYELHWSSSCLLIDEVDVARWKQTLMASMKKRMSREQIELVKEELPVFTNVQISKNLKSSTKTTSSTSLSTNTFDFNFTLDELRLYAETVLIEYNKDNQPININYYDENVRLLFRLLQTFQSPFICGHTMILSEGSAVTPSMIVHHATSIANIKLVEINVSSITNDEIYTMDNFKVDFMQVLKNCGLKNTKQVFMLTELETVSPSVYVLIEELIQLGNMAHLFTAEDKISVINSIRTSGEQEMTHLTQIEAWNKFIKNIHANFYFVGILSSKENQFERIAANHQSLMTSTEIIYLKHWSKSQLVRNATFILKNTLPQLNIKDMENLAHIFAIFHTTLKKVDENESESGTHGVITNKNFELMIERFCSSYNNKQVEFKDQKKVLESTLELIKKSSDANTQYEKKLEHEKVVYEQKRQGCNTLLVQIGQDQAITVEQVRLVKKTKQRIKKLEKLVPEYEEAHKRAVFKAVAIVKETKEILMSVDNKGLTDLRTMQKPDSEIEDLLAAIIIIVKSPTSDLTWNRGAKRIMANLERFREEMLTFDESDLAESTLQVLQSYIDRPHFAPMYLGERTQNQAINSLVLYVRGVVRYNMLMQSRVKPYLDKVNQTTLHLREVQQKLNVMQNKLTDLDNRLRNLSVKFEEASVDKVEQGRLINNLTTSLTKAAHFEQILLKLTTVWNNSLADIKFQEERLFSGLIVSCAYSVYMGPYNHQFRKELITNHWLQCLQEQGMVFTCKRISKPNQVELDENEMNDSPSGEDIKSNLYEDCMLTIFQYLCGEELCKHLLTLNYQINDFESLALMKSDYVKKSLLVIDPANQLQKFIKYIQLPDQPINILNVANRDHSFIGVIERSICNGALLIVENLDDTIDALFYSMIYTIMATIHQKPEKGHMKFNGHRLSYNSKFQLILVSRLKQPTLHHEFATLCSFVNLSPPHQDIHSNINLIALRSMLPTLQVDMQKSYFNSLACLKQLKVIDATIISKVCQETGLQASVWTDTEAITNLVKIRDEVSSQLTEFNDQLNRLNLYIQSNNSLFKPISALFTLFNRLDLWKKYYITSYDEFIILLCKCLKEVYNNSESVTNEHFVYSIDDTTVKGDDIFSQVKQFLSEATNELPNYQKFNQSDVDPLINYFSKEVMKYLQSSLSPDDFETFIFTHDLQKALNKNQLPEEFIKALLTLKDKKLTPSEMESCPRWLSKCSYSLLLNTIDHYKPIEDIITGLTQHADLFQEWSKLTCPDKALFPIKNMTDFSQLLTINALRVDRFYEAMMSYWNENFKSIDNKDTLSYIDVFKSLSPTQPILIIKDTFACDPIDIIKELARVESISVEVINLSESTDDDVDSLITSIVQKDAYLIIDQMDLASKELALKLYQRCLRLQKQYDEDSKWRIFIIGEICNNLSEMLLKFCHVVSLASLTNEKAQKDIQWRVLLQLNILKSNTILVDHYITMLSQLTEQETKLLISLCILHAYMISTSSTHHHCEEKCTERYLLDTLHYVTKEMEDKNWSIDKEHLHEIELFITQNIYITGSTYNLPAIIHDIVTSPILEKADSIIIDNVIIPYPTSAVAMEIIVTWYEEQFNKANSEFVGSEVRYETIVKMNREKSERFLDHVCLMLSESNVQTVVTSNLLQSNIKLIKENRPDYLQINKKSASSISNEFIETFLHEEYKLFNSRLSLIESTIKCLNTNHAEKSNVTSISMQCIMSSLSNSTVPKEWLRKYRDIEYNVDLTTWIQELKLRHRKLQELLNKGEASLSDQKSLNLNVFERPSSLIYLLKSMKAKETGVEIEQIYMTCSPLNGAGVLNANSYSIMIEGIYLNNATFLKEGSEYYLSQKVGVEELSCVAITAKTSTADEMKNYFRCPLFYNQKCNDVVCYIYLPVKPLNKIRWTFSTPKLYLSSE